MLKTYATSNEQRVIGETYLPCCRKIPKTDPRLRLPLQHASNLVVDNRVRNRVWITSWKRIAAAAVVSIHLVALPVS